MCAQIHLFKRNLPAEYKRITPFHSVSKWGKGANHVTIISSLIKDRLSLRMCTQIHLFKGNLPAEYD